MMATAKKFYSRMVSFLTALVVSCTTAAFTISTASGADVSEEELSQMANEAMVLLNEAREEAGLKPLYAVPYLNECAKIRAEETVEKLAHTRPDGTTYSSVVDTKVMDYWNIGENIAVGSDNAADTVQQWRESAGHWANVMGEDFTHTGLAVAYAPGTTYCWHWVQIFWVDAWDDYAEYEGQYLPSRFVITPVDEGDVNGDAAIDSFDYVTLVEYIRKKKANEAVYFNDAQLEAADCFKDGLITEADAKCMMRYILGEYDALPFEF